MGAKYQFITPAWPKDFLQGSQNSLLFWSMQIKLYGDIWQNPNYKRADWVLPKLVCSELQYKSCLWHFGLLLDVFGFTCNILFSQEIFVFSIIGGNGNVC